MRGDLYPLRKSVHLKLTREQHLSLRTELIKYNLSMQDIFFELVEILLTDDKTFRNFAAQAAKRQREDEKIPRKMTQKALGDMDSEELYDLLERESRPQPTPAELLGVKDDVGDE